MNKEKLREKLHKYIDEASEEELEELLSVVEEGEVEYGVDDEINELLNNKEFVAELERRERDFETGKDKGVPWEEVHKKALERIRRANNEG